MLADEDTHHLNTETNKKGAKQLEIVETDEITGQTSDAEIERK